MLVEFCNCFLEARRWWCFVQFADVFFNWCNHPFLNIVPAVFSAKEAAVVDVTSDFDYFGRPVGEALTLSPDKLVLSSAARQSEPIRFKLFVGVTVAVNALVGFSNLEDAVSEKKDCCLIDLARH